MTQNAQPLWIAEEHVVAFLAMPLAIDAVEESLRAEARGAAKNLDKTHVAWGRGHTLHAIGGVAEERGIVGTKTWAHTAGGATPLLILFDGESGRLLAVIEAFALGQFRTAGIAGVATRRLSRADAAEMAIVGTGHQALAQVAAVAAVRPISAVRVYSPNLEHRQAFAAKVEEELGIGTNVFSNVEDCVDGALIVTLVTRATQPFLDGAAVAEGAHVNAIGAITPERAEVHSDLLDACAMIAVDSVAQAKMASRELDEWCDRDVARWGAVHQMSTVLEGEWQRAKEDVTLFKAMGIGLADLALGIHCLDAAQQRDLGQKLRHPERVQPRLRSIATTAWEPAR